MDECTKCKNWRDGGELSSPLYECPDCGTKHSEAFVEKLIEFEAEITKKTFDDTWKISKAFLDDLKNIVEKTDDIYFYEDFYTDLKNFFIQAHDTTIKITKKKRFNFFKR